MACRVEGGHWAGIVGGARRTSDLYRRRGRSDTGFHGNYARPRPPMPSTLPSRRRRLRPHGRADHAPRPTPATLYLDFRELLDLVLYR